jgi:hypothetical protein
VNSSNSLSCRAAPTLDLFRAVEVLRCTSLDNKTSRFAGILEPSDGLEPSTPSLLSPFDRLVMIRETSSVSFLMCPFNVRRLFPVQTPPLGPGALRRRVRERERLVPLP